ncbi:DUF6338 family protein (plasmid) [Roseomonas sp. CCTCC AB2023176]|uniref:DUF6338 family protein n=1 Tax=Roseomonas sp. CCTCC AB2023176 TaxID=3342640 RepID=UPI0035DC8ACF
MGDVKSLEQLALVAAFLSPGLIALFVRAQFLTGRMDTTKDAILGFFTLSTIYYGLLAPFLPWLATRGLAPTSGALPLFLWTVVGPALFGSVLGVNASRGWTWNMLVRLGLQTVHVIPTAWDRTFGQFPAAWVTVTMKDGSKVSGFMGARSFASSDPKERDLYIEKVYRVDEEGAWHGVGDRSILVPAGDIRCVEIMPDRKEA